MDKLRELTPRLKAPLFTSFTAEKLNDVLKYKIGKGSLESVGLKMLKSIAVADSFMTKNSTALPHKHEQKEIIIVYEGSILIEVNKKSTLLKQGDILEIEPNTTHSIINTVEDCHFIAITIPADKGFPNVRK